MKIKIYLQTGIIAWGVECGLAVPGVYANVSKALCFIDYATKCGTEGPEADFYGMTGCTDWAKQEYCGIQDEIDLLRELVSLKLIFYLLKMTSLFPNVRRNSIQHKSNDVSNSRK